MTSNEFEKIQAYLLRQVQTINETKGREYTNDDKNFLKNFYTIANDCGINPLIVWQVFFKKHIRAIDYFIKVGDTLSESIESRFVDALNYLMLGYALIVDGANERLLNDANKQIDSPDTMCNNCIHKKKEHTRPGRQNAFDFSCTKCSCTRYEPSH